MRKSAKPGDIIKLTKLRCFKDGIKRSMATPEQPAYFWVDYAGSVGITAKVLLITKDVSKYRAITVLGQPWAIANNDRQRKDWGDGPYEIVSEDEIPDYIWAEIAKRSLLGEDQE